MFFSVSRLLINVLHNLVDTRCDYITILCYKDKRIKNNTYLKKPKQYVLYVHVVTRTTFLVWV